jgi:hypothetical protein
MLLHNRYYKINDVTLRTEDVEECVDLGGVFYLVKAGISFSEETHPHFKFGDNDFFKFDIKACEDAIELSKSEFDIMLQTNVIDSWKEMIKKDNKKNAFSLSPLAASTRIAYCSVNNMDIDHFHATIYEYLYKRYK